MEQQMEKIEQTVENMNASVTKSVNDFMNYGIGDFKVSTICEAILLFIVCAIVIKMLMKVISKALEKTKLDKGVHRIIKSTTRILLYFIAILMIADKVGIDVTSLIAVLSVAGLAISLAVQGVLSNLAIGLVILLTRTFKPGDYIEAGSVSGTATEIGMIYTKLVTPDKKVINVPNSQICASTIINYTAASTRRIEWKFEADYDCKIKDVKDAILQVLTNKDKILQEPAPFVNVSAYKESSIEYVARVWVKNADYWDVYFEVMEEVKDSFDKNGIIMTFNHLNVHMINK